MKRLLTLATALALAVPAMFATFATPAAAGTAPALTAYCTNPTIAYTVAFPGDWFYNLHIEGEGAAPDIAACRFFSPQDFTVTPGAEPTGDIAIGFFPQSGSVGDGEAVTVDGHEAVRRETGAEGNRIYLYNIRLSATSILSVQTHENWAGDYSENKAILDRQMEGIELHPFSDVADSSFVWDIAWLYDAGITAGCAADRYCPLGEVTRGQMATFLDRTLDLPNTPTDFFTDDDGTIHEDSINRIAAAGITFGCAEDEFCPDEPVMRDQMASFLSRAFALPATATDFFTDDEGNTHETSINRVAAAGITMGCTATTYCPLEVVTRGQMAAFLHRAVPD